ncbi:MAG: 4Fe-4S binding protein [Anaerolineae bacterium]
MAGRKGRGPGPYLRLWPTVRRVIQPLAVMVFLVLFVWSRRGGWPASVVNAPMRIDPLAMLAHSLASRTLIAGSALALAVVVLTLLLGRVWCGWLCPLGALLDWIPLRRWRRKETPVPESWRTVKYGLLLTIVGAAALTNLTLLIFDPLTILFRTLSTAVWPAVDQVVSGGESLLYALPFLRPAVVTFDRVVRPTVLPLDPAYYRHIMLYAGVFAGVIALNLVASRFWCRYLCPLGALLGLLSKIGLARREVTDRCTECGACSRICPTGTIRRTEGYDSDPGECTMCLECLESCPEDAIAFPARAGAPEWAPYDPDRRHLLASLTASIAGVGLFRSGLLASRDDPHLVRPPGARENDLLSKCIRCGECNRACPTSAIQPAVSEAGLEGLWTPVVVPRAGYCDYSCNACGQVCPVQAIPPLDLVEKRQRVIGQAYIDEDRCIAWADGTDCIVCEEMCPVPEKAIVLDEAELPGGGDETRTVQRPRVIRDLCIGCGICEYKCPVNGEAAIRVFVPSATGSGTVII